MRVTIPPDLGLTLYPSDPNPDWTESYTCPGLVFPPQKSKSSDGVFSCGASTVDFGNIRASVMRFYDDLTAKPFTVDAEYYTVEKEEEHAVRPTQADRSIQPISPRSE